MKKLLVILLLFFPVHGAWAETFSISCDYQIPGLEDTWRNIFEINTKKKQVTNLNNGDILKLIVINDVALNFEQENDKVKSLFVVNRSTGKLTVHFIHKPTSNLKSTEGKCKKYLKGEKKF